MKKLISVLCISVVTSLFVGCSKETNEQSHASEATATASSPSHTASDPKH